MKLGTLNLTRRAVDPFESAALRRAFYQAEEPTKSIIALAGLHLACEGPPDWPESAGSFESRGQAMAGYLRLANIDPDLAISIGTMAIQSLKSSVTVAQLKESADFFGVTNLYTFAPGLPGATKDPPSGDAT